MDCAININAKVRSLDRSVQNCVSSCYAYLVLREDYREHLRLVQKEIGFKYLRFHGIFCDQMGVYREDKSGRPVYNFQYINLVYDFILKLGIRPFVELSFMPEALASGPENCFYYKGNTTPPKDMGRWNGLVEAFARHLIERYGLTEVLQWRFEVWNEPDIDYFWRGGMDGYFKLYENTARTLKAVHEKLKVGGPATSKNLWVTEMLDFCRDNQVPIDFLSTHHYCANSAIALNADGTRNRIYHGQPRMKQDVEGTVAKVRASAFPKIEVHYTEWNVTPFHVDKFSKDSEFTAPFILQTVQDIRGLLNSYSFWTFTDIFEEGGPPEYPFSGLYGMLNFHGLKKPAYHAFHWYAQLYPDEIKTQNRSLIATRSKRGDVRLLTWNMNEVIETDFTGGDYTLDDKVRDEKLLLTGLKGRYRVRGYCIDRKYGNPYRAWQKMGSPQYLKDGQLNRLQKASEPRLFFSRTLSCSGELILKHTLTPCAVIFYQIEKVKKA